MSKQNLRIPIVPKDGLYVRRLRMGNDRRLAQIFMRTRPRIPRAERDRIIRHWRTGFLREQAKPRSPEIRKVLWGLGDGRDAFAVCNANGHRLEFYAPLVDVMPPKHVAELIAHELAHVLQCTYPDPPKAGTAEEKDADAVMVRWDSILTPWICGSRSRA